MGLFSESEWNRLGYPKLKPGQKYYIDDVTAKWKNPFIFLKFPDESTRPVTHVRSGPQPVVRIWRPFYDFRSKFFEAGIYFVDLFGAHQIDLAKYELTREQALKMLDDMERNNIGLS
jgi:hypothetical protein